MAKKIPGLFDREHFISNLDIKCELMQVIIPYCVEKFAHLVFCQFGKARNFLHMPVHKHTLFFWMLDFDYHGRTIRPITALLFQEAFFQFVFYPVFGFILSVCCHFPCLYLLQDRAMKRPDLCACFCFAKSI